MTTKTKEETPLVVNIRKIAYSTTTLKLVGTKPLLVDRLPYRGPNDKQPKYTEEEKFQTSLYFLPSLNGSGPRYGFISSSVKAACVEAAGFIPGLFKITVKGLFFVDEEDGLFEIFHPRGEKVIPKMDRQMVIKKTGASLPVIRARFDEWELHVPIRWQEHLTNISTILAIFEVAGENIGLGCRRPQKSGSQLYGTFVVEEA